MTQGTCTPFLISPLVFAQLKKAGSYTPGYTYTLAGGDVATMAEQERFLREAGMDVRNKDVYPAFSSREDLTKALKLIWENKVEGWWNLTDQMISEGVCALKDVQEAFASIDEP